MSDVVIGNQSAPFVQTETLWAWDTTGAYPVVSGYPSAAGVSPTKTGLTPTDLRQFVGVPLQYYGATPVPVTDAQVLQWIRYAEDKVEQETSILLCQTYVASPPAPTFEAVQANGLIVQDPALGQRQGFDFDLYDTAYDFMFDRAQDNGWMNQVLRYRPVQSMSYSSSDYTAIKGISYVYPLLNTYFRVPPSWFVEDRDYGMVRLVPAQNVQMLPLFALQLAFMGFAENVPGAFWFQYTAGLTPFDYNNRWSFMKQLVLSLAAMQALSSIQGTINMGAKGYQTTVDGLQYKTDYDVRGPFAGLIDNFGKQAADLMRTAGSRVSGPLLGFL